LFAGRLRNQIAEVLEGKRAVIEVGPLTAVRDYLSTDEAAVQLLAIEAHGARGEIYHVASGVPITMRELLIRHLEASGLDLSIVQESVSFSTHSGYDVPAIYADINKTIKLMAAGGSDVKI
jgi:GDP-4-dehydro-6-deoxy-D-mannose reductase